MKCHHSTAGGIEWGAALSMDGVEGFDGSEADGEGLDLICSAWTPQRPQTSTTELNSSKLPPTYFVLV